MDTKKWIIFAAVVVGVLGSLVFLSRKDQVDVSSIDGNKVLAASVASGNIADHVFGNKESKNILIEYGDFQCPGCAAAHPVLKEISEEYKDKLAFVFRNNPLTTQHPNARAASAAAESAGLQGQYWAMHDELYLNQREWSNGSGENRTDYFASYAKKVGIKDIEKFKQDLGSKDINDKINFDLALGKKVPVTGTPTILLNGKKVESDVWQDAKKLKTLVEESLK